jgi:hypothetical protein
MRALEPKCGNWNRQGAKNAKRNSALVINRMITDRKRRLALPPHEYLGALGVLGGLTALSRLKGSMLVVPSW